MTSPQPISRRAALARGLSDADLRRLCRHGLWHRVRAGHYLDAPADGLSPEQRHRMLVRATTTAASEAAVVSHVSALNLHGLPVWRTRLDRAHLTRNRRNGARVGARLVVHAAQLPPDEVTVADGILCTTVARTLIDFARTEEFEQAVIPGDAALHRELTTVTRLREQLRRARNRPGYHKAATVIEFLDGRSECAGESRSRVALHRAGLPAPELQARVLTADNGFVARVDFLLPDLGVIGQFDTDAKNHHGIHRGSAAEQQLLAERRREHRLRALGWVVARWGWDDLDEPGDIVRRIEAAAAIAARTTRSGRWLAALRRCGT
jgi:hypothetical protein